MTDREEVRMDRPAKPNYRRRQLGRTLRKLREAAGFSQEDAGRPLRFSTSKMSRIEQGYIPGYNDFLALLDRYGIIAADYDQYVRMFDYAKEKGWWHVFGLSDRGFVSVEAEASRIRNYQLGFIPGLLQTEPYMRATFAGTRDPFDGRKLEIEVQVRLRRQRRLVEPPELELHAVIDESVIRRAPCDAAQLRHLLEAGQLPNVHLQVLPQAVGSHDGLYGNFLIASFPDPSEPDLAYVSYGFGALQVEKDAEVRAAGLMFDNLARLALDQADSRTFIAKILAERQDRPRGDRALA
ncbi:helix-turn-helix domain-containing protein [Amycolatopsis vancoresmycina]|uniref:helix-turn-helix domain-containing protein n=1 Tax=Amycolatopsis vancoresmycina TaxID=208444 RepID=UPI001FD57735|nr:helix-turn-helix transcriptional regulator [Amycolatopsis vancoresmycina]